MQPQQLFCVDDGVYYLTLISVRLAAKFFASVENRTEPPPLGMTGGDNLPIMNGITANDMKAMEGAMFCFKVRNS